jgi:hypothetical protein
LWSTGYSAWAVCLCQLVHPFRREGRWCGGLAGAGTLLGPEGTAACLGFFSFCGPVSCLVTGVGAGAARILRTAQWTRASH